MIINFDSYNNYETPVVTLANPNKQELGTLGNLKDLKITYNFNEISELSFTYPYKDVNDIISPFYDELVEHRLISVQNHGWWIIQSASDEDDGIVKNKNVTVYSLEYELASKKVNVLDGTYKFYDVLNYDKCLLGILLKDTGWTIDYIDPDLWNKYRTFEIADDTVYGFLTNTVRNSYECIFKFDTENRKVSAYTTRSIVKKSDIYIGYDNLIKDCKVDVVSTELYTAISVYGDEEIDISAANPLGTLTIYNYDYFKSSKWMSEELVEAINNWNQLIELNKDRYRSALLNLINSDIDVETLKSQLVDLQTDLAALEQVQGLQISGNIPSDDPSTYKKTLDSIASVKNQIDAVKKQISTGKGNSSSYQTILNEINYLLKRENNFTEEQLVELNNYTKEGTFQDDTFIITDVMTESEKQQVAIDLYDAGMTALEIYSQPSYTIEVDAANFLLLKEYKVFTEQTELGATINLEVERGNYIEAILLSISLDFDNPSNFKLTFGNRYKLNSAEWQFNDLYQETSSLSNQINFSYNALKKWENKSGEVVDFINSTLDATRNALVTSSGQEMIFDGSGLRGRKLLDNGTYDDKQMWLTSNTLAFTRDGWDSVSLALGEITLPNDAGTMYGLAADAIVGKLLMGSELIISNETSSFLIDNEGIKIKVGDDDTLTNISTTINGINTSIKNINGDISEINIAAGLLESRVKSAEGNISTLAQTDESIKLSVQGVDKRVNSIEVTLDGIDFNGFVTFTDLSTKGQTTINGSNITTGKVSAEYIDADNLYVAGLIDGADISISGDLVLNSDRSMQVSKISLYSAGASNAGVIQGGGNTIGITTSTSITFSTPTLKWNGDWIATEDYVDNEISKISLPSGRSGTYSTAKYDGGRLSFTFEDGLLVSVDSSYE